MVMRQWALELSILRRIIFVVLTSTTMFVKKRKQITSSLNSLPHHSRVSRSLPCASASAFSIIYKRLLRRHSIITFRIEFCSPVSIWLLTTAQIDYELRKQLTQQMRIHKMSRLQLSSEIDPPMILSEWAWCFSVLSVFAITTSSKFLNWRRTIKGETIKFTVFTYRTSGRRRWRSAHIIINSE